MLRIFAASLLAAGLATAGAALAQAPPMLPDLFTPAPHGSALPLPQIGRTRSATVCRSIVNWSATAANSATENDTTLNALSDSLPNMLIDDYPKPKQEVSLQKLRNTAAAVRARSRDGLAATSRIRAYAQSIGDLAQRASLVAYATALTDALQNQDDAAVDLVRALVIAEGRRASFDARIQMSQAGKPGSTLVLDEPGSYHSSFTAIAQRIDEREADIQKAEAVVAERAKQTHC